MPFKKSIGRYKGRVTRYQSAVHKVLDANRRLLLNEPHPPLDDPTYRKNVQEYRHRRQGIVDALKRRDLARYIKDARRNRPTRRLTGQRGFERGVEMWQGTRKRQAQEIIGFRKAFREVAGAPDTHGQITKGQLVTYKGHKRKLLYEAGLLAKAQNPLKWNALAQQEDEHGKSLGQKEPLGRVLAEIQTSRLNSAKWWREFRKNNQGGIARQMRAQYEGLGSFYSEQLKKSNKGRTLPISLATAKSAYWPEFYRKFVKGESGPMDRISGKLLTQEEIDEYHRDGFGDRIVEGSLKGKVWIPDAKDIPKDKKTGESKARPGGWNPRRMPERVTLPDEQGWEWLANDELGRQFLREQRLKTRYFDAAKFAKSQILDRMRGSADEYLLSREPRTPVKPKKFTNRLVDGRVVRVGPTHKKGRPKKEVAEQVSASKQSVEQPGKMVHNKSEAAKIAWQTKRARYGKSGRTPSKRAKKNDIEF